MKYYPQGLSKCLKNKIILYLCACFLHTDLIIMILT